ncbi:MAG: transglycosylase domain-containing protein [Treponema sp.]|nr:transglycosylase domain-containing protein [Treponema sp.]
MKQKLLKKIKSINLKPVKDFFVHFYQKHKKLSLAILIIFGINYLSLFVLKILPYKELKELQNKPYSTRIYDANGYLIQVTSLQDGLRREWIPYNSIPDGVKKVFLEAEDKRFFFHHGVDYLAALNALKQNSSTGRTVRGASTITMQLSKIITPSVEKSFSKKVQDVFNALKIEAKLSKKQILELYLNTVPFGMNSEGITSAARTFFGKEIEDLTPEEICLLSVIPRSPSLYNPINNPEACAQKAFLIYKDSFKTDLTDEEIYTNLTETAKSAKKYTYPFYMPHFINYLQAEWKKSGEKPPYEIQISADLNVQFCAEKYLAQALEEAENARISNGAVLVINNHDNSIVAWVGSGDFYDDRHNGQIDGVLALNQPGSSMKPFLYATAMEMHDTDGQPFMYPSKILQDIPKEYGEEKIYIPANFNNRYNGPIRMRVALASSLNVPAVDTLSKITVETYVTKLYELGIDFTHGAKTGDLGIALGVEEVSLKDLVTAFSVFPRDGLYLPLTYRKNAPDQINKINRKGKRIFEPDTARIICSILSDKASRSLGFGYTQTFQTEYPSMFKTGTANQYQNIVALGATPDYTIGVWMGNFSGETVIGKTGSSLPAWAARNVLDLLTERYSRNADGTFKSFEEPENYIRQRICTLSGHVATENCPASMLEYIPKDLKLRRCNWHRNIQGTIYTYYPPEYQQWFRIYGQKGLLDYHASQLQFLTPNNNSVYYMSDLYKERQAIDFEIIGGQNDEAKVYLDGNFYKTLSRPFFFYLPLEKGSHSVKVICGNQNAELSFQVK